MGSCAVRVLGASSTERRIPRKEYKETEAQTKLLRKNITALEFGVKTRDDNATRASKALKKDARRQSPFEHQLASGRAEEYEIRLLEQREEDLRLSLASEVRELRGSDLVLKEVSTLNFVILYWTYNQPILPAI